MINGERLYRCPLTFITDEVQHYLSLYSHYKNGFLPVAGGILDQSNRYYEVMIIIDEWVSRLKYERTEKERQKIDAKNKQSKGGSRSGSNRHIRRPARRPRR